MSSTGRLRRLFVTGLVGVAAIVVTAGPASGQEEQPTEVPGGWWTTEEALEQLGYGVAISYRPATDTIVVLYRDGPDDRGLANAQIVQAVWQHEPYRFTRLEVQRVGGTTSSFSYDDLAALLGPRPAGLDASSLDDYVASMRAWDGAFGGWAASLTRGVLIIVGVVGGGLFLIGACIALGGWAASRPRVPNPSAPHS